MRYPVACADLRHSTNIVAWSLVITFLDTFLLLEVLGYGRRNRSERSK